MNVKPMIFNTDMVRALVDGKKTQTRRPFTKRTIKLFDYAAQACECSPFISVGQMHANDESYALQFAPVAPGDLVYVRERFCIGGIDETDREHPSDRKEYVHQDGVGHQIPFEECIRNAILTDDVVWKPSIHMPREFSRITLKVTGVRVERVQTISGNDCISEGFAGGHGSIPGYMYNATPKEHFANAWQEIYGDHWQSNGWCWVIDFEVIHKNVDHYIALKEVA